MPTLKGETIERVACHILQAAGAPGGHARTVASHLADANLAGHDSHGLIRIPQYVRFMKEGRLRAAEEPQVVKETVTTAQVDGRWTFGQVVAKSATELAIGKAREAGVGFVTMYKAGHTGRIGAYPEMAAHVGIAAIMWSGSIGGPFPIVAPFGGRRPKLGTNPVAMAFPSGLEGPILLDFATSMAAEGKLRVYRNRGKPLPDAWIINSEGVPSTDPNDFYNGGALLPVGGLSGGHKGYALSFIVGLFGLLAALGSPEAKEREMRWGSAIVAIDISRFAPLEEFQVRVREAVEFVKDTPPMEGFQGVLYPGEIEARTRQERLVKGVEVEETTWNQILECVREYGLEDKLAPLP